jgi:chaperonin GroES
LEDRVIQPIQDYVLIRRHETRKIGRFFVPARRNPNDDLKPRFGTVEAVGPGKRATNGSRLPMPVAVGDVVMFSLESGYVTQLPGLGPTDTRLLIRVTGILAVLEGVADESGLGEPWPGYIVDGPQDNEAA